MNRFQIDSTWVGPQEKTYFIADVAANHDGSLERAKKLIELAKEAGADAAKFQNFQAPKIVSQKGFDNLGQQLAHQSKWEKSVFDVYQDASVSQDWTPHLKEHCRKVGIAYFTTPYDIQSVDHVDPFVSAFKIGSGDITYTEILSHMASKKKPLLLATGASSLMEVIEAVGILKKSGGEKLPLCLMQCNTNYTASLENFKYIQLNVLKTYASVFPELLLGLSDHTPHHATVLGAIALGARVIEKHFTDDNDRKGPDHLFSMNPKSWREMVERSRELELALGGTEKKIEHNEIDSSVVQRRSLHLRKPLKRDEIITKEHIEALRPAPKSAITPNQMNLVLGMKAAKDYQPGDCLKWSDWAK